ncbi:hypothetical protein D9M68_747620 [compost metagenome]
MEQALSALIPGWKKALLGVPSGSKLRIIIPSDLAYGNANTGLVPARSVLDFTIEIVEVED